MNPKPNNKKKLFNLDGNAIKIIEELANHLGISQSSLIEQWAFSFDEKTNPHKKIKNLKKQQKEIKEKLSELEKKENKELKLLEKIENFRQQKQKRKPLIINNLKRILNDGRYEDAEQIAKSQGIKLGLSSIELLHEAIEKK